MNVSVGAKLLTFLSALFLYFIVSLVCILYLVHERYIGNGNWVVWWWVRVEKMKCRYIANW